MSKSAMTKVAIQHTAGWLIGLILVSAAVYKLKSMHDAHNAKIHARADCIDRRILGHKPLQKISLRTGGSMHVGVFSSYFVFGDKVSFSFLSEGQYFMGSVALEDIRVVIDNSLRQPYIDIDAWGYREDWACNCEDIGCIFRQHVKHVTVHCQSKDFPKQVLLNF